MQSKSEMYSQDHNLVNQNADFPYTPNQVESIVNDKDQRQALVLYENQETPADEIPDGDRGEVKEDTLPSPPDGGYGWFIVLGSFITHVIIGALERSEGIFFLQFQAKYKQSASITAWPGAISITVRLMVGPVASAISNHYSVRSCSLIGSLLLFLALLLTSFTPNFYFLFISHGFVEGLAHGLTYAPGLILVGMYFDKRRGFATGLACSGVGVGTFIFIPIIQLVFDTYGLSGTFLILSAWSLHSAVVAMLQRPLRLHYKFILGVEKHHNRVPSDEQDGVTSGVNSLTETLNSNISTEPSNLRHSQSHPLKFDKILPSHRKTHKCRNWLSSSLQICFPKEDSRFAKQTKKKIFHFYLLKSPAFVFFCLAIMMFTAANKSCLTFIPSLIKSKGFTDTEAALVISIMGVFDTVGRMSTGFLFDFGCLRRLRPLFYNIFLLIIAAIVLILPLLKTYVTYCIICSVFGLLCGAYISQKAVIIVDILGPQHMASSFGMLITFQGIGAGAGPPLSGFFRDVFGSFSEVFYLGGGIMLVAGAFMFFSNVFLRRQR